MLRVELSLLNDVQMKLSRTPDMRMLGLLGYGLVRVEKFLFH
jgi:hypothetical protein